MSPDYPEGQVSAPSFRAPCRIFRQLTRQPPYSHFLFSLTLAKRVHQRDLELISRRAKYFKEFLLQEQTSILISEY